MNQTIILGPNIYRIRESRFVNAKHGHEHGGFRSFDDGKHGKNLVDDQPLVAVLQNLSEAN